MIKIHEGERVVAEVRRHWFVFVVETMFLVAFITVPAVAVTMLQQLAGFVLDPNNEALVVFFSTAWLLLAWVIFFIIWTNYYLDAWFITDQRIVDVEQHGLFSREMSECRLERIQDVTAEVRGVVATALHFGDVHVQTAGETRRFTLNGIPKPYDTKNLIFQIQSIVLKRIRQSGGDMLDEEGH